MLSRIRNSYRKNYVIYKTGMTEVLIQNTKSYVAYDFAFGIA